MRDATPARKIEKWFWSADLLKREYLWCSCLRQPWLRLQGSFSMRIPASGFLSVLSVAIIAPAADTALSEGLLCTAIEAKAEIALTDSPFCTFFVVVSEHGYVLVDGVAGYEIFSEGDLLRGDFSSVGVREVELVTPPGLRAKIGPRCSTVKVEDIGVPRDLAKRTYYRRCKLDRSAPPSEPSTVRR
jgi:hypothetical protein